MDWWTAFLFWSGVGMALCGALGAARGNWKVGVLCGVVAGPLLGLVATFLVTTNRKGDSAGRVLPADVRERLR